MMRARACLTGLIGVSVLVAAAIPLLPVTPVAGPNSATHDAPRGHLPMPGGGSLTMARSKRDDIDAVRAAATVARACRPTVVGAVRDETGAPVAGVAIAMVGCADVAVSGADGSFEFCAASPGACRVVPADDQLSITSPLLDLCSSVHAPVLIVARSRRIVGRVTDLDDKPVAAAKVAVELDVSLLGVEAVAPARAMRVSTWTSKTDDDGWYTLPCAPCGSSANLVVEREGFVAHRASLAVSGPYRHVRMEPVRAGAMAGANGGSESLASHCLVGGLRDANDSPLAGWWAAVVADRPAGRSEQHGNRVCGRLATWPVQLAPDGGFSFTGLPKGSYVVEAWHPGNRAAVRTEAFVVPGADLRLVGHEIRLPQRLLGRVLDERGRPVVGAVVGLARPSAWAVPGRLAMHGETVVATDRVGRFEIECDDLAALELRIDEIDIVPQRVAVTAALAAAPIEVRVVTRRWLVGDGSHAELLGRRSVNIRAFDDGGSAIPIWVGDRWRAAIDCELFAGAAVGLPAPARSVAVVDGSREFGRLWLQ